MNSKNWERFTQRARRVLSLAQEEAERLNHSYIGSEHVLIGLLLEEGGVAGRVLRELGLEVTRVQAMVERLSGGQGTRTPFSKTELSPSTKRILEYAVEEARRMGQHYISTEHLLLGLARQNEGLAIDVLRHRLDPTAAAPRWGHPAAPAAGPRGLTARHGPRRRPAVDTSTTAPTPR